MKLTKSSALAVPLAAGAAGCVVVLLCFLRMVSPASKSVEHLRHRIAAADEAAERIANGVDAIVYEDSISKKFVLILDCNIKYSLGPALSADGLHRHANK